MHLAYAPRMRRLLALARGAWLDAAAVLAALVGVLEVALRQGAPNAPRISPWVAAPALALIVLPLLLRRRWAFAAPAAVWVLAAALSFVDGRLVGFSSSVFVAGMAAAFVLGNAAHARLGLLLVGGGAAIVLANAPSSAAGDFVFLPALFGMSWLGGLVMQQ